MNTYQFPEFDQNLEESSMMDSVGKDPLTCEADWIIYGDTLVKVSNFTEGILVGGNVLVMIFSGCGNIAALIIVARSKAPKLSTKYFLIVLALSDLLMTAVAPPVEISKLMADFNEWYFGEIMCKLIPFFQVISATMSGMALMAIAVERNFLIVRAMSPNAVRLNKLWEKFIVPVIAVSIILLPIGCAIPQILHYTLRTFIGIPAGASPTTSTTTATATSTTTSTTPSPFCDIRVYCVRNDFDKTNIIYWSVTGSTYFFLVLCFFISYISIYKFVKEHGQFKRQLEEENFSTTTVTASTSNQSNDMPHNNSKFAAGERHRKSLKLIIGLIILHLGSRLPNWIYVVVVNVHVVDYSEFTLTILECLHLLSTVNCALNPFMYVIWNHSLRANGDGVASSRKGRSSELCKKTGNICHTICCSCCRKYKRNHLESHATADPVILKTSSAWSWKNPKIYHVSDGGSNENITSGIENQQGVYHERSDL